MRDERKDAAIQAAVGIWQEIGLTFLGTVDKVAQKFKMSQERAAEEVKEYWQD